MSNAPLGKVFVGLSGGVDSSVSALLLKKAGYEVVGVFIKVWQADFLPCSWREERRDAMRAAAHIGIPFLTLNLEQEYKQEVVDYMLREYKNGNVPNPDVMCNKHVKFGAFLSYAKSHGADFIATGHYAQVRKSDEQLPHYELLAGVDKEKDQSYFLWTLTQEQLAHTLFPIGHLQKSEVRKIAMEAGLPNSGKKDSQGLCFMGPVDMEEFLKHFIQTQKGDVLDEHGKIIGSHTGSELYTIGQRHGFTTTKSTANDKPFFVVAKDIEKNTLTVAHRDETKPVGKIDTFSLQDVVYAFPLFQGEKNISVRLRYRGTLHEAKLESLGAEWRITLKEALSDIASGQSAVFYDGEMCLGGGVVNRE